jgi:hypothetical protein
MRKIEIRDEVCRVGCALEPRSLLGVDDLRPVGDVLVAALAARTRPRNDLGLIPEEQHFTHLQLIKTASVLERQPALESSTSVQRAG